MEKTTKAKENLRIHLSCRGVYGKDIIRVSVKTMILFKICRFCCSPVHAYLRVSLINYNGTSDEHA